ncbi:MAG: hypothetical protein EHM93_15080 [Bacteroidales bacterium]|nr:MAG: hypothetical protein EHM93_15080 [Bacteroidales bacterium]
MDFPSIFISKSAEINSLSNDFDKFTVGESSLAYSKDIKEKVFIINTANYTVFGHVNIGCRKKLIDLEENIELLVTNHSAIIADLHWGFLVFIGKKHQELILVNDIYGIYPLYYSNHGEGVIISNDFDGLAQLQSSLTINEYGVYDYLLFNYTLRSRTLFNEMIQLEGGSRLKYVEGKFNVETYLDIASIIVELGFNKGIVGMCDSLKDHLRKNVDLNLQIQLPLTGGFDSKIILSLLLDLENDFSAYTFGDSDSPDSLTAKTIVRDYGIKHKQIGLSDEFLRDIELNIEQFIKYYPNAPMLDTLLYYLLVLAILPPSNIVTGKMGGELIVGPVLISELITTRAASLLTQAKNKKELISILEKRVNEIGFFNYAKFSKKVSEYTDPLLCYTNENQSTKNLNIAMFLLRETYAKFFGPVFNVLFSKHNLINPFVDVGFVKELLNSKYSFLKKKPFSKKPFSHFLSRRLYPLLVKKIYPSVLNTPMDRGYNLKDFLHWYNFPKPFLNYINRHYIIKKPVKKIPVGYLANINVLVEEKLASSLILEWDIFNKDQIIMQINEMKEGRTNRFQNQRLIQLLTLHYINLRYSNKIIINKND